MSAHYISFLEEEEEGKTLFYEGNSVSPRTNLPWGPPSKTSYNHNIDQTHQKQYLNRAVLYKRRCK